MDQVLPFHVSHSKERYVLFPFPAETDGFRLAFPALIICHDKIHVLRILGGERDSAVHGVLRRDGYFNPVSPFPLSFIQKRVRE